MNKTTDAVKPGDKTKPGTEDSREPKKELEVLPKGSKVDLTKEEKPKETFKKDEELVKKDVEEKTRVEEKPTDPKILERISGELWERLLRKVLGVQLTRIERMLEWLVVQRVTDNQKLIKQPNISDIFKEILSKMEDEKKKDEKKKDEVPPTT